MTRSSQGGDRRDKHSLFMESFKKEILVVFFFFFIAKAHWQRRGRGRPGKVSQHPHKEAQGIRFPVSRKACAVLKRKRNYNAPKGQGEPMPPPCVSLPAAGTASQGDGGVY